MADVASDIETIEDPRDRALAVNARIEDHQAAIAALSRVRRDALEELLGNGLSQTQVADLLGLNKPHRLVFEVRSR